MDVIQVNNVRSAPWAVRKFPPIWPNGVPTFKTSARDASTHFVARSEPCVPLGSVSKGPDMVFCSKVLVICSFSGRPKGARKRNLQQGLSRLATFGRAERVLRCKVYVICPRSGRPKGTRKIVCHKVQAIWPLSGSLTFFRVLFGGGPKGFLGQGLRQTPLSGPQPVWPLKF